MAVIVLGLVAYLEWFGLWTGEDGRGECEEEEEKKEPLSRGEKVKSTMKLGGPGRCESARMEAAFIGLNCLRIHFAFGFERRICDVLREGTIRLKMLIFVLKTNYFPPPAADQLPSSRKLISLQTTLTFLFDRVHFSRYLNRRI